MNFIGTQCELEAVAAQAFRRGGVSCLLAAPLEVCGSTISATHRWCLPVPVPVPVPNYNWHYRMAWI